MKPFFTRKTRKPTPPAPKPAPTQAAQTQTLAAVSPAMAAALPQWRAQYTDNPAWAFDAHGARTVQTLNLPAVIAGKVAKHVTLGARATVAGTSRRALLLSDAMARFFADIRRHTELAAALGGAVFKPYVQAGDIHVDVVLQDEMVPVAWSNTGDITAAIFKTRVRHGGVTFEKHEYHHMEPDGYHIDHRAFRGGAQGVRGQEIALCEVPEWADITPETVIVGLGTPLFAYFKMPQANAIDPESPMGAAVFSRASGLIQQADLQMSRILWEFEGAELAIDADVTALGRDATGQIQMPKRDKRLFRNTRFQGGDSTGDFYKVFAPDIRDESLFNGLHQILRQIEQVCGLSCGTLTEPPITNRTATEIRYSQQDMLATVRDTQHALAQSIQSLADAMDALASIYKLTPAGKWQLQLFFPDAILGDPDAEKARELLEVQAGLRHPYEYRMRWFAEDEETAKAHILALSGKEKPNARSTTESPRADGGADSGDTDPLEDGAHAPD